MTPIAQIRTVLISRLGSLWSGGGDALDPVLGQALRDLGGTQADLTVTTQADLDTVPASKLELLLDAAELRALEQVQLVLVQRAKIKALDLEISQDNSLANVDERIALLRARLAELAGLGRASPSSITVHLPISSRCGRHRPWA